MPGPWLSVIMPTFNGSAFLPAALESIAVQADDGIEVIAVDDGSTDGTLDILRRYDCRINLRIVSRTHTGNWVESTNVGMSLSRGQWIGFLHQDDVWLPGRVARLRTCARRHSDAALILHPSWFIDTHGRRVGRWRCPLTAGVHTPSEVVERLLVQNFIALPAPIFRRDAAYRIGRLEENLWYTADWDWWLRLVAAGRTVYVPRPLAGFRVHGQSQTINGTRRENGIHQQLQAVLERHLSRAAVSDDVRHVARFAMKVNTNLAASIHSGNTHSWGALTGEFARLGPLGWHRFFRDSRVIERVSARLRARLWQ